MRLTGGEIIAEMLARLGVKFVSGIPGHTVIDFVDALYDRQERIRCILPRHEGASAFMADAYYRVTGKPAAVFGHISVGSANLLTGVVNAYLDSSAMIVITGEAWSRFQGRGAYQELDRQRDAGTADLFRGCTKRSWLVDRVEKLPEVLLRAFKVAVSGRPGPVHIAVTQEAMAERVNVDLPEDIKYFVPDNSIRGSRSAILRAAELLVGADRPVILVGGGGIRDDAVETLMALVEATGIPVATTVMGKGAFPEDHPLALGVAGWVGTVPANLAMREAEVVLAVGTRLTETDTSGWEPNRVFGIPPTKLIQVNIEPSDIGNFYPVEVGIVGDAGAVVQELLSAIRGLAFARRDIRQWVERLAEAKSQWTEACESVLRGGGTPVPPGRVVAELQSCLSPHDIIVSDVGNAAKWIAQQYIARKPRTVLSSMSGAAMGFGACGALGAALGAPGRKIVAWVGDGSMAMCLYVLPTLAELGLPVTYLILNDYGYGSIRRPQDARYGRGRNLFSEWRTKNEELFKLDFASVARSLGIESERVTDTAQLGAALRRGLNSGAPYIIDIEVQGNTYVPLTGGGTFVLPPLR